MRQEQHRSSARWSVMGALLISVLFSGATLPDSAVADAAMKGDIEAVRALLKDGADVNAAQGDGMTALHWAAEAGDIELVGMLLYAGANPQGVTRLGGYTPLHLASKAGRARVVAGLLEAGADPVARTTTGGVTPLHFAAVSGSAGSIEALLAHGAAVDAKESVRGQSPLMLAAALNRVEAVRVLLGNGADVSLLSVAIDIPARARADREASARRDQVFAAFKEEEAPGDLGWQPDSRQVQAAVRAAWATGPVEPAEEDAPEEEDARAPEAPLGYGDNVGGQGGFTALIHAAREGNVEAAMALLDGGADIDQLSSGDHSSPLLIAVINGHLDAAMLLLEQGADPNLASDAGATPLFAALNVHWAPKARYPQQQAYRQQQAIYLDVMEALLEAGADPDVRLTKHLWYMSYTFDQLNVNTTGATAFWRAAYATDVPAMQLLIAHGADPSIPTAKAPARRRRRGPQEDLSGLPPVPIGGPGVYPLHAATGVGYGEGFAGNAHRHVPDGWLPATRYLVEELGLDVNARDLNGYAPLHHAAARGDNELIRYLVEQGADVMVVSRRGQTTVDMANGPVQRIQPFPATIALLEGLGAINNHNCVSC
jgi:ankyrin repeat protein